MHQVVTAQLAARRSGTQSTKTRAEVRGGGAKPWKQKGTGRARQGSIRSPQWKGGGVALGPKPRSYAQRTPKKMIRLALRSALSDRAADGKVVVVDGWGFDAPSTQQAAAAARRARARRSHRGRRRRPTTPWPSRASATCPTSTCSSRGELNAYDVLVSDYVVFTRDDAARRPTPTTTGAEGGQGSGGEPKAAAAEGGHAADEGRPAAKKARDAATADATLRCSESEGDDRHGQRSAQPPQEHG